MAKRNKKKQSKERRLEAGVQRLEEESPASASETPGTDVPAPAMPEPAPSEPVAAALDLDVDHGKWFRVGMGLFIVLVVLAMFPYTGDPTGDIKRLVTSWAGFLMGGAWLAVSWRWKIAMRRPRFFLEMLLLFLAFNLVAALHSSYVGIGFVEMRRYWALFLVYCVASQVYRTQSQVERLMAVICLAMLAATIYGFFQKAGMDFFPWADRTVEEYRNLPATFGNPNYAGHALILAIIMAVYLGMKKSRLWFFVVALVLLAHLYFTHQRTGAVALAAAVVVWVLGWVMASRAKSPVRAAVTALVIVAVVGVVGLAVLLGVTKVRTGSAAPLDASLLIRYNSYCSASRMILGHPALGYGPGAYEIENAQFWTPYEQSWFARRLKMNAHVHNDTLEIAVDAGLPAAGLYLAFLVFGIGAGMLIACTSRDARQRRMGLMFAAFFMAFFVDGCLGFNLRVPVSAVLLFVMAGAMEGLWSPSDTQRLKTALPAQAAAWRAAVAVVALVCVVFDSRVFASEVYLNLGERETLLKNDAKAKTLLERGERLAPWNGQFGRELGLLALTEKDFPAAVTDFDRSLDRNPYYVVTLVAMARAKMGLAAAAQTETQTGNQTPPQAGASSPAALDEAQAYAERALALCPDFARTEEVLGRVASMRAILLAGAGGKTQADARAVREVWTEAAAHLSRAILLDAENLGEVYRLLARVLMGMEDKDGAEEALVRSVQIDPASTESWASFYEFAQNSDRFDRLCGALEQEIDRARQAKNPDPETIGRFASWLGRVYSAGYSDPERAETSFRESVRWAPLNPRLWRAYAQFALKAGRKEAFLESASAACQTAKGRGETPPRTIQAMTLMKQQGAEGLDEAAKLLLTEVDAEGRAGRAAATANDIGWAGDMLLDTAREAPPERQGPAYLALGVFYAGIGEHARADRLYPAALPNLSAEDQSVCVQRWAQTLMGLQRPVEAINLLRQRARDYPEDLGLRLSLARVYERAGMRDLARKEYEDMLAMDLDPEVTKMISEELQLVTTPEGNEKP